jgi:hypothetical protein
MFGLCLLCSPGFSPLPISWKWVGDEVDSVCSQVATSESLLHEMLALVHQNILRPILVSLRREKVLPAFLWLPLRCFIPLVFCFHSSCLGVARTCLHYCRR